MLFQNEANNDKYPTMNDMVNFFRHLIDNTPESRNEIIKLEKSLKDLTGTTHGRIIQLFFNVFGVSANMG